ncbi:MAG: alpha/beta fold hydrolase [Pelobium sp.]
MGKEYYVGSKSIQIIDELANVSFNVLIQYPTEKPSQPVVFGPYIMDVSLDAIIIESKFPLVLLSHGNGGSHLLYRTITSHLVKKGYIVAVVEHYGNNRNDNSLENTSDNLIYRPRHVSLTIDFLLQKSFLQENINENKIAVLGHSMGGYTALALAGGIPRTKEGMKVDVTSDSRIKTIILLAPGAGWFLNGLEKLTVPILMLTAEHDPVTPRWNADIVLNGVPNKDLVEHHEISNAGHFSFLSPFPENMKNPNFLPSTDPVGFDREKFHLQISKDILGFLDKNLEVT